MDCILILLAEIQLVGMKDTCSVGTLYMQNPVICEGTMGIDALVFIPSP